MGIGAGSAHVCTLGSDGYGFMTMDSVGPEGQADLRPHPAPGAAVSDLPVALPLPGRRVLLKWHRGRQRLSDPAFSTASLIRGMSAGASVEIDLQPLSDGGFAVIHDPDLDRETTGLGPVRAMDSVAFQALHRRDNAGSPLTEPALTLSSLAARIAPSAAPDAILQLDLQCRDHDLSPAHIAGFRTSLGALAGKAILSGEDANAVQRLAAATPGLSVGYDPCAEHGQIALARAGDWPRFVDESLCAMPEASTIYLALVLPILASDHGFDLIGAFHARGRIVDCFTLVGDEPDALPTLRQLARLGADQITTDDPEGLLRLWASDTCRT
jgi:glycerophosphoryl diester phosphodiesterase